MSYNPRLNPMTARTGTFASVATNASSLLPVFSPAGTGQIINARFINGATSSVASGTTAGSALNVYVYKTASDTAASAVAKVALGVVATLGTATVTMGTSTALTRFVDGDVYSAELIGGAGNNRNNAGCIVQVAYMYAQAATDDTTI